MNTTSGIFPTGVGGPARLMFGSINLKEMCAFYHLLRRQFCT